MYLKFFLFSLVVPILVKAQDSSYWNLKNCIEYGIKNNRNRNIYINKKLAADEKAKELLSAYLPSIGLNGTFDDNLKVQQSLIPAGDFIPTDTWVALPNNIVLMLPHN